MKHRILRRIIYALCWPLGWVFLHLRYRLTVARRPRLPERYLVIGNHTTNLDPVLAGFALRRHMYFVATEHILYTGKAGGLLRALFDPIARPKGGNGTGAVLEILRRLKGGANVCLFAEGNCSWDGRTQPFLEATGKMVRSSGASLVTIRTEGAYFAEPRWRNKPVRGPVRIGVVNIYSPEELKSMTPAQINAHIAEDIREDAYETLEKKPAVYPGKNLAAGIEHLLVMCPACRSVGTLRGEGKRFSCRCGLSGTYDEHARLSGEGVPFGTLAQWSDWQKEEIARLPADERELAHDDDLILNRIEAHARTLIARGRVSMTPRELTVGEQSYPLSEISDMAVRLQGTVSFSLRSGGYYELVDPGKERYSGYRYYLLYQHFREVSHDFGNQLLG